ncbi:MAG: M48 family metalloprotease [Myxococcota bacterium]|nr:M48 family metalloprotease [Myxococcota bacterium]
MLLCRRCQARNRVPLERAFGEPERARCGSCQAPLLCGRGAPLSGLTGAEYQHPLDRQSLQALESVPGVSTILKKLVEVTLERYDRLFNQSSFVRVGGGQLSSLERLFERAAYALGLRELPELYVYHAPEINAYTGGVERPYVAVSSALCDLFTEEEVVAVLSHELSHWQSQHVLYKIAARLLTYAAGEMARYTLGVSNLVLVPLQLALLKWDRCSELTADRGMLLAVRNPHVALRVLLRLCCASQRLQGELSLERFMQQAQQAREASEEGVLDRFYTLLQTVTRTHPFPLWRAAELWSWACDGEYLSLLGRYA